MQCEDACTFAPCFWRTSSTSLWPRSDTTWNGVIKLEGQRICENVLLAIYLWNLQEISEWKLFQITFVSYLNLNTHSLFFSWMLAPFRSSSSVTCLRLGWAEATAQCCKHHKDILTNTSLKPSGFRGDHVMCSPEQSRVSEGVWSWWSLEQFSWPLPCPPHGPLAKACVLWTHLDEGNHRKSQTTTKFKNILNVP